MVTFSKVDSNGHLELWEDPKAWIKNNPASRLALVTSLKLCINGKEEIGEFIGELTQLIRLEFYFCRSLKCVPANIGQLVSLTHLKLYGCNNIKSLPMSIANLSNLTFLSLSSCDCLVELPANIGQLVSLTHLELYSCKNIKFLPDSIVNLSSLTSLTLFYCESLVELPENIGQLASLTHLNLYGCENIKFLPDSITALGSLRLLMLPVDFRLHTLPSELKDQITISVNRRHVRKTWKELKEEISFSEVRLKMAMGVPQHSSIISPSGYLRLKGDPGPWIQSNFDSLMSVQILELEDLNKSKDYSLGNLTQLNHLTHLYISDCRCFLDNYFANNTSLGNDSLSKLSNLETLHIDLNGLKLPAHINFPSSIKCLSLLHGNMKSLHDSLAKLLNLKTIDLYEFCNLNLFPTNLYLAKVRLIDCSIVSLPTCLLHLEILCNDSYTCKVGQLKCINKLVNLKTLSISCKKMEFVPRMKTLSNLETLQFKDCFSLKELPSYLGELVSLRNLDISGTRIRSLPGSIMELCNLQHLILPRCFNLEYLPRNFKEVFIIDNTHETYYKRMGYFNSRFQTSTETSDGNDTAQGCIQTQENCNEDDNIVPVAGVDEMVTAEQTSANDIPIFFNMENSEPITSEQGAISQVYKDSQFDGRKDLINENSQYVACSLQNQFPSSGNDDFVTIFDYGFTTEQIFTTVTSENDRLPTNVNADKILDGYRLKYNCSMLPPLKDLINIEHLDISLCVCSEELLATLKNSLSLGHLAIKDCKQQHHVKEFPANLNVFANLQTLFIQCSYIESLPSFIGLQNLQKLYIGGDRASRLKEFPADLDKLDKLLAVDIHDTKIKCLPWSVMTLQKLRFLFLPLDFRLETLPCQLNESVVITVDCLHIRKSWKELKREMRPSSIHGADSKCF